MTSRAFFFSEVVNGSLIAEVSVLAEFALISESTLGLEVISSERTGYLELFFLQSSIVIVGRAVMTLRAFIRLLIQLTNVAWQTSKAVSLLLGSDFSQHSLSRAVNRLQSSFTAELALGAQVSLISDVTVCGSRAYVASGAFACDLASTAVVSSSTLFAFVAIQVGTCRAVDLALLILLTIRARNASDRSVFFFVVAVAAVRAKLADEHSLKRSCASILALLLVRQVLRAVSVQRALSTNNVIASIQYFI